jgi:dipeptidyl aminopeptidase/acylaminoacyl peptidase
MKRTNSFVITLLFLLQLISANGYAQTKLETPGVESILYLGDNKNQPLIVGFGGSEGRNAWSSDYWKKTRDQFLDKGYAFLAIGYFGCKDTPDTLNRIAIDKVYEAIKKAAGHSMVNRKKIALIGGSRGADLALLIASYYKDIDCVVSIVGSSAVFPGHTSHYTTPCWTYKGKDLPFLPVNEAAVPFLKKGNLRRTFEAMLTDTVALESAAIPVEKIKGPILFLSATKDHVCPSTPMAEQMKTRLNQKGFKYTVLHKAVEGGHAEPLKHFDTIFTFLENNFRNGKKRGKG